MRFHTAPLVSHDGSTVKDVYKSGIYAKNAMLMHTLRYVIGDSLFFPMLKKFATNVKYPYNQFFTTADVELFFIKETGKDLSPIFNFYLNTTKEIEINVYQLASDRYNMTVSNAPIDSLPLDIATDSGIIHTIMDATIDKPFRIESKTPPVIGPRGWYFRKIIFH